MITLLDPDDRACLFRPYYFNSLMAVNSSSASHSLPGVLQLHHLHLATHTVPANGFRNFIQALPRMQITHGQGHGLWLGNFSASDRLCQATGSH